MSSPSILPEHLAGYTNLTEGHAQELHESSVPPETAAKHRVYSAHTVDDLPEWARWTYSQAGDAVFPVMVCPMTEADGSETGQVKPQDKTVRDVDGGFMKYVSPSGGDNSPQLPVVRDVPGATKVLLVEGVKQALAADAYWPEGWAIYRFCGITGWLRGGVPTSHLKVVRGKDVFIAADADTATKHQVYDGADALGRGSMARRAKSVLYVQVTGTGNAGVDDLLAGEPDDEARRELVQDWIETATAKPAPKRPKEPTAAERKRAAERKAAEKVAAERVAAGRPVIHVGDDRRKVIHGLIDAVKQRFDGRRVFAYGDSLARLDRNVTGPVVTLLTDGDLMNVIAEAAETVAGVPQDDEDGICEHARVWPEKPTWQAVQARHAEFTRLDGVSSTPIVRHDGSVVVTEGYDPATRIYVHLTDDIRGITVPEHPTDEDIEAARNLLLDDLLVDFPLKDHSDRANAVAALLTPLVRNSLPLVPLAVIDGLQMGVGKGYLMNAISVIHTGRTPDLGSLPESEEEVRKSITATLAAGQSMVFYDETHTVAGAQLSRAMTARTWTDRRLGRTAMLNLDNNACWYCAGNNVQVLGDMARRYYPVRLHTNDPDPQNRSSFKHNLVEWVPANRRRLLEALLTLVRAWYSRGCPRAEQSFTMGSFEHWQKTLGGILNVGGIEGFLEGLDERRVDNDFDAQHWEAHLGWLVEVCGTGKNFTAKAVVERMAVHPLVECPPGMEDLPETMDSRALGKAWSKHGARWRDGLRIRNAGVGGQNRTQWVIDRLGGVPDATAPPTEGITASVSDLNRARQPDAFEGDPARPMPLVDGPTIAELSA